VTPAPGAWLVVVAAGRGERLGAELPKAVVAVGGRPLFTYAVESAAESGAFAGIVLVGDESALRPRLASLRPDSAALVCALVRGGERRRDSVRAGLQAVRGLLGPSTDPPVLVHDAARPFAPPALFRATAEAAASGGVVCGLPPADTVKRLAGDAVETLPRASLWLAQTPQGAPLSWLERAHARDLGEDASDDAALLERAGAAVRRIDGDRLNFKITTAADRSLAEAWIGAGGAPWMATRREEDPRGTANRTRL
jgi:2-C-methyl-D-erythritol 4-phosphate cytidylyltransferase